MNFRNSVAARLFLGFGIVILMFAAAITLSISRLSAFNNAVTSLTGAELTKVETADAWTLAIAETMSHTRTMLLLDDKAKIQTEVEKVRKLEEDRRKYADTMTVNIHSPEGKALLQSALDTRAALGPLEDEILHQVEAGQFKEAKETLLERARPLQNSLKDTLKKLSEHQRAEIQDSAIALAASYQSSKTLLLLLSVLALSLSGVLAFLITRAIRNPLAQAVGVLGEIGRGNYDSSVTITSSDETGRVLTALDAMQSSLKERTERDRAAAMENARIRTALDKAASNIMVADTDGRIAYMNESVLSMFRSNADEIRKHLPQFDPDRVLGSNFDSFHRNPSHQRNLLAVLRGVHTSDILLGNASLRIIATPVTGTDGQRVGTVVQWIDRTQEVSIEQEVQGVVTKALDGDLTARIRVEGKEGFFKSLAGGMNQLVDNVAELVRTVIRAAGEVRVGAEEISQGNTNLSQRTEGQASSLEETAASMEEMTSTVKNNADNAEQASQLASAARVQAEKGGAVVNSAVAAMNEINAASKKISDIIGVIDEIAFQTNLLALNAAVEAARAGDQGRGFAVVASEVRNLASRSAEAAKQIKGLIQDSVGKVSEGAKLVDDSGRALADIVVGVKKVTDVMAEIAASSQEQAAGVDQVNKAVMSMDEMTQQNAALVEEAAAATQALSSQAVELTQLLSRYRVGDAAAAPPSRSAARPAAAQPAAAQPAARRPASVGTKERRSSARPWSGTTPTDKTAAQAAAPAHKAAAGERAWNEF